MGGSGPAHAADPALGHRMDSAPRLCSELERFQHGNIKALGCCHPPTAPTATPAVPHSCTQETEPRRTMQSPGWAGRCSMHRWAHAAFPALAEPHQHMHLVTARSHELPSPAAPLKTCEPCPPQSLQGAGSSTPGTWVLPFPLTLWHQHLVPSLFCTGDLLLPRDCWGILLTPSSSD